MTNPYELDDETDEAPQTPDDYYGRTEAEKKRTPASLPAPAPGLAQNPWVRGQEGTPQPAAQHGLYNQAGVQPQGMGQQQPPPRVPVPQPPPEVPFTQADNLQLQRLQQAQSTIQQQLESGDIDQNTADDLHRQVSGRLQPLQAKQKAQQQKQQQEQQQQMMQQTALAESMQSAHRQTRAKSFPSEVATYTDPVTGATMHMIQDHKGDWKEATFDRHHAEQEMVMQNEMAQPGQVMAGGGEPPQVAPGPLGDFGKPLATPGHNPVPADFEKYGLPEPGTGTEEPPAPEPQPGRSTGEETEGQNQIAQTFESAEKLLEQSKQTGQPVPIEQLGQSLRQQSTQGNLKSETPLPRILNQFGEEIGSPGATRRGQRDAFGRPTGEIAGDTSAISQAAIAEMYRRADGAVPRLPDGASPAMQLHRAEQVNHLVSSMMGHHLSMANHREQRVTLAQEHRQQEQTRAEEHGRHEKAMEESKLQAQEFQKQQQQEKLQAQKDLREQKKKEEDGLKAKQRLELIHKHMGLIDKENYEKDPTTGKLIYPHGGDLPEGKEYLKDEDTRYAKAVERTERDMKQIGDLGKPAKQTPPGVDKDALEKLEKHLGDQRGKAPALPLDPEEFGKPSKVTPERVAELQKIAESGVNAIPFNQGLMGAKLLHGLPKAISSISIMLRKAKDENRGLTKGERAEYERHHADLESILKEHGGAGKLRLIEPKD